MLALRGVCVRTCDCMALCEYVCALAGDSIVCVCVWHADANDERWMYIAIRIPRAIMCTWATGDEAQAGNRILVYLQHTYLRIGVRLQLFGLRMYANRQYTMIFTLVCKIGFFFRFGLVWRYNCEILKRAWALWTLSAPPHDFQLVMHMYHEYESTKTVRKWIDYWNYFRSVCFFLLLLLLLSKNINRALLLAISWILMKVYYKFAECEFLNT